MTAKEPRRVHIDIVKKTYKGKTYKSVLLRSSYREGECLRGSSEEETAKSRLFEELQLGAVDVHELYGAMDWLLSRQKRIENKLAKKHLQGGTLLLYDVSSSYYMGRKSSLVRHGYSRDHRGIAPRLFTGFFATLKDGRSRSRFFPATPVTPPRLPNS